MFNNILSIQDLYMFSFIHRQVLKFMANDMKLESFTNPPNPARHSYRYDQQKHVDINSFNLIKYLMLYIGKICFHNNAYLTVKLDKTQEAVLLPFYGLVVFHLAL